ncbi:MAG: DUF488 family protein [Rhodospirillales bacterium]|nr:DUF488 family protein [Rhodospirillales bacterium]
MPKRSPIIKLARAYDHPQGNGEYRALVDRLWPRGVRKETLELDRWLKDLAPSSELRKWFDHRPERWDEFRRRYFLELDSKPDLVAEIVDIANRQPILLIYASRDTEHNQAVALREYLLRHISHT